MKSRYSLLFLLLTACASKGGVSADGDGDGYTLGEDCDDRDPRVNPDAVEVCDGVDNDCDGLVDASDDSVEATTYADDEDGDGYGDAATGRKACSAPWGMVANADDCDDGDADVNPRATERWYDGVDQDCSGGSDYDQDGDGYDSDLYDGDDCDDLDDRVAPGAEEIWYDGVDQDCADDSDYDQDGDGYDSDLHGGDDCDDLDADHSPATPETHYDGVDANCTPDDEYDADGDGYDATAWGGTDCDDTRADVHLGATEVEDGLDNNCNGEIDDLYDIVVFSTSEDFGFTGLDGNSVLGSTGDGSLELAGRSAGLSTRTYEDSLPVALSNVAAVATASHIYVMGGFSGTSSPTASSAVYSSAIAPDGTLSSWASLGSLSSAVGGAAATTDGNCVVLAGGISSGTTAVSTVRTARVLADGSLGSWNTQASLPGSRGYAAAAFLAGYVYVVGGYNGGTAYDSVYYARLDPDCSIDAWTTGPALPGVRYHLSALASGGRLLVLGGHYYYGRTDVWSAAPASDGSIASWSTEPTMPTALHGQGAAVSNGYLWVLGGNDESETLNTIAYAGMRSSSTLTSFSTTTATLLEDRAYYALVAWSGNLYAIGGGVGDLTSGSSTTLTRTATVERIPFRTTGTSYAYNARNLYTVDFGSDVEILFADWSYLVGSTGTASLAWRVAPSSTGNAEAWNELGSSGYEVIDQVGRYLQLDVTLYCTDTGSVILEDLTLGYR